MRIHLFLVGSLIAGIFLSQLVFAQRAAAPRADKSTTAARLTLRTEAAVKESVFIGDIADVSCPDAKIAERLRAVSLGYAPALGAARAIPRSAVVAALRAAGFAEPTISLGGAETTRIRRDAQTIDIEKIHQSVAVAMLAKLGDAADITLEIMPLEDIEPVPAPLGTPDIRVAVTGVAGVSGTFPCVVEIRIDGRVVRRLSLQAKVNAYADVFALSRTVAAGERIRESDGSFLRMRLSQPISRYVTLGRFPKSVAARRTLPAREPILRDALVSQPVVKPGDLVKIIGRSDAVVVEVGGEARGTGRIGDRIQVRNKQSGVLLTALVEDEGVVSVKQ